MRVLVTNDDGVGAPGIHELAACLADDGHDVLVVAPSTDHSGFGAAVGPLHVNGQVAYQRVELPGLPQVEAVAVDGPPALCVLATCLGGFGSLPVVVVSGINAGANTGRAVLHSGTVGAALTANGFGLPAIAVSQAVGDVHHWATAAQAATALVPWVAANDDPLTLNVNVPNLPVGRIPAHVAMLDTGGEVQASMVETGAGVLQMRFTPGPSRPGTDTAILAAGCIAITPIVALQPCDVVLTGAIDQLDERLRRGTSAHVA